MAFFPSCSIDGCLKLFELEIKYSLCPSKRKKELIHDMQRLKKDKDIIEELERLKKEDKDKDKEEIATDIKVDAWKKDVDKCNNEVEELLSSLSEKRCWQLHSNCRNGGLVDEMLRIIRRLLDEGENWKDPNKLFRNRAPQISPSTATEIPEDSSTDEEPWRLFCSFTTGSKADVTGNTYARDIVNSLVKCCGSSNERLNLAMRVVAGTLNNLRTDDPWKDSAEKLRDIAASQENIALRGTPIIESILRFCYDRLGSDQLRDCLSCCASIDFSSPICELDILVAWIGEGLLDDRVNIDQAYDEGYKIIRRLRSAHWLESSDWCDFYVTMDVHVQSMVRIASGGLADAKCWDPQSWRDSKARRVSSRTHACMEVGWHVGMPPCPLLIALLVSGNKSITKIHDDFFGFTPQLLVLNLSDTEIVEIPPSIGLLKFLRFLKLSRTNIRSLPKELGDMEDLRQLEMNETRDLISIPAESISNLSKLQALFMNDCGHEWNQRGSSCLSLEILRNMTGIQQLYLTARTKSDLTKIRSFFGPVLKGLALIGNDFTDMRSVFSSLKHLEVFELGYCPRLEDLVIGKGHLGHVREIKLRWLRITTIAPEPEESGSTELTSFLPELRHFALSGCHSLRHLTWIGHLAKLELMCLEKCEGMTMLIDKGGPSDSSAGREGLDDGGVTFPKLQFLVLHHLPRLSSFSWRHPLRLPSLRTLRVRDCSKLKKLPFGPSSCMDMREIKGTWDWWNNLEWDSSDIKEFFAHYFKPY